MKIISFYFSGTGNTKYIAEEFKKIVQKNGDEIDLISIEKNKTKKFDLADYDLVGIFYPVYGSTMPAIVKEFLNDSLNKSKNSIKGFSITTYASFSGDGAIVPKVYFDKLNINLKYAFNIKLSSNFHFPLVGFGIADKNKKRLLRANAIAKLNDIYKKMKNNEYILEGDKLFSRIGGASQRLFEKAMINYSVKINSETCINCSYCYNNCPTGNLVYTDKVETTNKCIVCMRCINKCPVFAIRIISKSAVKPFTQYTGPL